MNLFDKITPAPKLGTLAEGCERIRRPFVRIQNLNDRGPGAERERSAFWHGRAWIGRRLNQERARIEWAFGRKARSFHFKLVFGDYDRGLQLIAGFPFLFDLYLSFPQAVRVKKSWETGIAIHNQALWIYPASWCNEWNSQDPWYRCAKAFHFPWELEWRRTELLSHDLKQVLWSEDYGRRDRLIANSARDAAQNLASRRYLYRYTLRSGQLQITWANVYPERRYYRARWWPLIPRKYVDTSINVQFDKEIGEGVNTYKGGVIGTGEDMLPGETCELTLLRMEATRKFDR